MTRATMAGIAAATAAAVVVWWFTRPKGTTSFGPLEMVAGALNTGPGTLEDARIAAARPENQAGQLYSNTEVDAILNNRTVADWEPLTIYKY